MTFIERKQEIERLEWRITMLERSDRLGKNHRLQRQIENLKARLERTRMGW